MTGSNDERVVSESVPRELSFTEIVELALKPARALGAHQVQFGGGETLLRDDAVALVQVAVELGYEPRLLTNGVLFSEEMAARLARASSGKLVMVFGINSACDPESNRNTRDVEPDTVIRAMALCQKYGLRKHVVVNVGRHNMKDLECTFQWLEDRGLSFNRSPFVGRNSGRDYFRQYAFSREDMERYIHPALVKRTIGYISYTPFFLSPELHRKLSGGQSWNITIPQNPQIGCWVGSWIAIGVEGGVSPCATLLDELTAGNIRETPLAEIISESEVFRALLDRHQLKGKCGRCRYKLTCGGCRALAFYHSNDYLAEDPTCFFDPADERTICRHEEQTNKVFERYVRVARLVGLAKKPGSQ